MMYNTHMFSMALSLRNKKENNNKNLITTNGKTLRRIVIDN